jgi:hypothetical protein
MALFKASGGIALRVQFSAVVDSRSRGGGASKHCTWSEKSERRSGSRYSIETALP